MQGSKYPDELREQALGLCAAKGMTPKKVAEKLGVPLSTIYDWCNKANQFDPEFVYARQKRKKQIVERAMKIIDAGVTAIGRQVYAGGKDRAKLEKLMRKVNEDPWLSDGEREGLRELLSTYAAVGMGDLTRAVKEIAALDERFAGELMGEDNSTQVVQISFDMGMGELAE